jgi:hypothetical protein
MLLTPTKSPKCSCHARALNAEHRPLERMAWEEGGKTTVDFCRWCRHLGCQTLGVWAELIEVEGGCPGLRALTNKGERMATLEGSSNYEMANKIKGQRQPRGSPSGGMNFNLPGGPMDPIMNPQYFKMNRMDPTMVDGIPNGMRPPSSHPGGFPNQMTPQQMAAMAHRQQQAQAAARLNWQNGPNGQMIPQPAQGALKRTSSQRSAPPIAPQGNSEPPPKHIKRICVSYTISEDMSGDRGNKILSRISGKMRDSCEVRLRVRGSYEDRWSLKHQRKATQAQDQALAAQQQQQPQVSRGVPNPNFHVPTPIASQPPPQNGKNENLARPPIQALLNTAPPQQQLPNPQQQLYQQSVMRVAAQLYETQLGALREQYPNEIVPEEHMRQLRFECQRRAAAQVTHSFRQRRLMFAQRGMQQHQQNVGVNGTHKIKKRKDLSTAGEERPLTHGAHGLAPQDGTGSGEKTLTMVPAYHNTISSIRKLTSSI